MTAARRERTSSLRGRLVTWLETVCSIAPRRNAASTVWFWSAATETVTMRTRGRIGTTSRISSTRLGAAPQYRPATSRPVVAGELQCLATVASFRGHRDLAHVLRDALLHPARLRTDDRGAARPSPSSTVQPTPGRCKICAPQANARASTGRRSHTSTDSLVWLPVPRRPNRVYRLIGFIDSDGRAFDRRLLLAETLRGGDSFPA